MPSSQCDFLLIVVDVRILMLSSSIHFLIYEQFTWFKYFIQFLIYLYINRFAVRRIMFACLARENIYRSLYSTSLCSFIYQTKVHAISVLVISRHMLLLSFNYVNYLAPLRKVIMPDRSILFANTKTRSAQCEKLYHALSLSL